MPEHGVVVSLSARRRERLSARPDQPGKLNFLQNEVLRQAQSRWGAASSGFLETLIEADTWQVEEWLCRLPFYFDDLSDLVHCRPLPVKRVWQEELIRRALAEPLSCWLVVLMVHPGRAGTNHGVPWLRFTEQSELIASDLVLYRCCYLAVEDPRLARALFDHLPKGRGARAKGQLYSPEGILVAGEPWL